MQGEIRPLWAVVRHEIDENDKPHHAATRLLRRMGIVAPSVPVESIARHLNIKIIRKTPLTVDGVTMAGVLHSTRAEAQIWVNGGDQPVRQRFTIAHEIGHLVLHNIGIQYRDHAFGPSSDWKENQANDFAASLLMPLWMLEPIVIGSRKTAKELAALFEVSLPAMKVQLGKLL